MVVWVSSRFGACWTDPVLDALWVLGSMLWDGFEHTQRPVPVGGRWLVVFLIVLL